MDENLKFVLEQKIGRTIAALAKNNIPAIYTPTKEEARKKVEELLSEGDSVACGGSMSLQETGVLDLLRSGPYTFYDREAMPPEEAYRRAFSADVYLMSANAVTEQGELYNVDGNGNRVAALIYGPRKVVVVAGCNKIVEDIPAAVERVKRTAAPPNGVRLETNTPCAKTGRCIATGSACGMTAGCSSPRRMCCQYVITGYQREERIHVILVGEEIGY